MFPAGFEPAFPATERLHSYVLYSAVTGIGCGVLGVRFEKFRNCGPNLMMAIIVLVIPYYWLVVLVWRLVRREALRTHKEALPNVARRKGYTATTWRYFGKQSVGRPRGSWGAEVYVLEWVHTCNITA